MNAFGQKTASIASVFAVGILMAACSTATSADAQETKTPINVEIVPQGEPADITETANLTRQLQNKRRKFFPPQKGKAVRGVHPKSHGCVAASFIVPKNIGSDYQVGLFATAKTYKAMIRYSNASVLELADLKGGNGSRGMAIKVFGVNGPMALKDGDVREQDFLMINTPEFAFANVRDYLRLTNVLMAHPLGADPRPYFVPAKLLEFGIMDFSGKLSPPKPGESPVIAGMRQVLKTSAFDGFSSADMAGTLLSAKVVGKIQSQTVRNPLEVQYFGAAPFRFGPDRVMKFSVVPAAGAVPQKAFNFEEAASQSPDYLALTLAKSMAQAKARGKTIHLSFLIQAVENSLLAGREKDMIENAALGWSETEIPSVKVAHIIIDPAAQQNENFVDACKPLRFTPWYALAAHEPLGGINRLRKPVYCESGKFRPDGEDPSKVLCQAKK